MQVQGGGGGDGGSGDGGSGEGGGVGGEGGEGGEGGAGGGGGESGGRLAVRSGTTTPYSRGAASPRGEEVCRTASFGAAKVRLK